jgi:hypothetical protein
MPDKMTEEQFVVQIQIEGGIISALEYGLRASDLAEPDSALGKAWAELERVYTDELTAAIDAVEDLLPDEAW